MLQSHIIEIDGTFLGAAVRQPDGYKFVAVDKRLSGLTGRIAPTLGWNRDFAISAVEAIRGLNGNVYFMPIRVDLAKYLNGLV